jgi:hypothetical protein
MLGRFLIMGKTNAATAKICYVTQSPRLSLSEAFFAGALSRSGKRKINHRNGPSVEGHQTAAAMRNQDPSLLYPGFTAAVRSLVLSGAVPLCNSVPARKFAGRRDRGDRRRPAKG